MKRLSIGFRLTVWYLAIFAAAQLFFGVGMWLVLQQDLYSGADVALTAQVEDLTNFLKTQKKKNTTVAKLREEAEEAYAFEHSGDFLQIYDKDGNWIFLHRRWNKIGSRHLLPSKVLPFKTLGWVISLFVS